MEGEKRTGSGYFDPVAHQTSEGRGPLAQRWTHSGGRHAEQMGIPGTISSLQEKRGGTGGTGGSQGKGGRKRG